MRHAISQAAPMLAGGARARRLQRMPLAAAVCACLVSLASAWHAHAEDEGSSTQVYLVFDPETGEFVTSHDPNAALPPQTGLETPGTKGADASGPTGATGSGDGPRPMLLAAAAAVVVVGGASLAFLRSRRKSQ